jgi:hypothetical protein
MSSILEKPDGIYLFQREDIIVFYKKVRNNAYCFYWNGPLYPPVYLNSLKALSVMELISEEKYEQILIGLL